MTRVRIAVFTALCACGGGGGEEVGEADGGGSDDDGGGFEVRTSDWVYDETQIRHYEITVAEDDWQWLGDNAQLEEYVPATLHLEGDDVESVAIRYKGGYGSLYSCFQGGVRVCDKLSIKLKFSEYEPERRLYGLKRINFHSMQSDPSNMHDAIGYKLFRDAGVFAPRTAYARLSVNGESLGLFIAVEAIDGRFTRSRFPDGGEGNLYKEVWPEHDTEAPFLEALKTNEDEMPSVDKMLRFTGDLQAAGDDGFRDMLGAWTDLDHYASYMAVARLIDHWDGTVGWYCVGGGCFNHNYYWYESTTDDRVWIIPWDLDHTFEEPSPIRTYYGMPDWDDVDAGCDPVTVFWGIEGRPPACDDFLRRSATQLWDLYAARSAELIDGPFSESAMRARIDQLEALIADEVAADPDSQTTSQWRVAVDDLRDAAAAKRQFISGKL